MKAIFAIDAARCGRLKAGPEVKSFRHRGRALEVTPLNANPYVLIDVTQLPEKGVTPLQLVQRVEFVPEPRSGTDMMRARISASLFLDRLPEDPAPDSAKAELVIQPMFAADGIAPRTVE